MLALSGVMLVGACTGTDEGTAPTGAPTTTQTSSTTTASTADPTGSSRLIPEERAARAQLTLDTWATAVQTHDEPSFQSLVASPDPAFASRSATLWATLDGLPLTTFTPTLASRTSPLSAERQTLLGPDAWVQQTMVTWRLAGETESATHRIWLTFVPVGDAVRLAGATDGDTGGYTAGPQPLWWIGPVTAATARGSIALVSGHDSESAAQASIWAKRAAAAAREVATRVDPDRRWSRRLVIEVPRDQTAFERVLGVTPGSYASIAAVAWPEGADPAKAALRIIVNPGLVEPLTDEGLAILLTHEATHVATRSAASAAPVWLVEGYADAIAYDAHPSTVKTAAAVAWDDVTRNGPPSSLPSDADFGPGAAGLNLTYARAWLACRYVVESSSRTDLNLLYEAVDGGMRIDAALQSVLGVDETTFVRRWRIWLTLSAQDR